MTHPNYMHYKSIFFVCTCQYLSNIYLTHLLALNQMVRKAAGSDLVVLIKGALEKFVWVTVSFIFKIRKTINYLHLLGLTKSDDNLVCKNNFSITTFLC